MRRAAKVDANQKEIVELLRQLGLTVQHLHNVGKGCPDLLVGHNGINYLIEVKDGLKGKLTKDQIVWHNDWKGQKIVIRSLAQALSFVHEIEKIDDIN